MDSNNSNTVASTNTSSQGGNEAKPNEISKKAQDQFNSFVKKDLYAVIALGGTLLAMVGTLLPWISIRGDDPSGLESALGELFFLFLISIAASLTMRLMGMWTRFNHYFNAFALSIFSLLFFFFLSNDTGDYDKGIGYWLSLIGVLVAFGSISYKLGFINKFKDL